jgi:hypothetical protein
MKPLSPSNRFISPPAIVNIASQHSQSRGSPWREKPYKTSNLTVAQAVAVVALLFSIAAVLSASSAVSFTMFNFDATRSLAVYTMERGLVRAPARQQPTILRATATQSNVYDDPMIESPIQSLRKKIKHEGPDIAWLMSFPNR